MTAPRAPANRAYIPEPGDTDQDRLEWATNEIARLRAELAALREPVGRALMEVATEAIKTNYSADYFIPSGIARAVLDAVLPRVRAEGWRTMESAPRDGAPVLLSGPRGITIGWCCDSGLPGAEREESASWRKATAWRPLPPPPEAAP